jgi:glycosyltransferase involved in cell wall biosynthesis
VEHRADVGGGQVSLIELLKRLDRGRFEPLVSCVSRGELYERVRELGIDVEIVDIRGVLKRNPLSTLAGLRELSRLVKARDVDLIHANSQKAVLCCAAYPGLLGIPLIWHCRVPSDFGPVPDLVSSLRAGMIIAISEHVRRRFKWLATARRKLRVIPNGIDTDTFQPQRDGGRARAEFGIGPRDMVVGSAGRLAEEKGQEHFLQAARVVASRFEQTKFLVVGGSEPGGQGYRERLERIAAEIQPPSDVIFTGYRSDMADLIAAMDIVVVPSLREGFGRVAGEAMAMGKAVVCSDVGGIPEIVVSGKTGVLVPPGDADALAREVSDLIASPDRISELGKAARRRIEECFSIGRHVRLVQGAYEEMLTG